MCVEWTKRVKLKEKENLKEWKSIWLPKKDNIDVNIQIKFVLFKFVKFLI